MTPFNKKIVFWGCGQIGNDFFEFCNPYFSIPDYFCDSNPLLWGEKYNGITVISPCDLKNDEIKYVFITVNAYECVLYRLQEMGIEKNKILLTTDIFRTDIIKDLAYCMRATKASNILYEQKKIFVDLSCGMVLGGVERWSYYTAENVKNIGLDGEYLIPFSRSITIEDNSLPRYIVGESDNSLEIISSSITRIKEYRLPIVICNFPFEILQAACVTKKFINKRTKVIAVIHNDESIYYEVYGIWKKYIDIFFAISKKIYQNLVELGFPQEKIRLLSWNMIFPENNRIIPKNRRLIKIGYAGRLSYEQKRVDLLVQVALGLKKAGVDFVMQIAGVGDYMGELQKRAMASELGGLFQVMGYISHDQIYEFWNDQDIYISCSEYEGHSISQTEAMAMGVVPIVTRTSGTEDDIKDGYNGYIVEIGDTEGIIQRIISLCDNPKMMQQMSKNASETIRRKNNPQGEIDFWKDIFGNV